VTAGRGSDPYYSTRQQWLVHPPGTRPKGDAAHLPASTGSGVAHHRRDVRAAPELKPDVPEWTRTIELPEFAARPVWFARSARAGGRCETGA